MIYKQGDVILVPFPQTDQFAGNKPKPKNRPAVIINADWFFTLRGDHIVVALTSQSVRDFLDIPIRDYLQAGLLKPSVARIGKYNTIHPVAIVKKLGQLTDFDLRNLMGYVAMPFTD